MRPRLSATTLAFVLPGTLLLPAAVANAQVLDEITVTATKREAPEFSTPLSIEALTGEEIAQSGIRDFEDLAVVVPNLFVGDGVVGTSIAIRGAGSGTERGFEQAVGMFIDGVYMPRSRQYRNPFFDAKQVEVVRGPQAVLFGLNATAGAVSVVSNTTAPGADPFVELGAAYETEFSGRRLGLTAGGGAGERFGLRLAAQVSDSGDGFITNLFDQGDSGASEETLIRFTALYEPTDDASIKLKYSHADFDIDDHTVEFFTATGSCVGISPGCDGNGARDWTNNVDRSLMAPVLGYAPGLFQELDTLLIAAEWVVGDHTLFANVAYSDYAYDFGTEIDATPLPILDAGLTETLEQYSSEFRVASPIDNAFSYIVGAYVATSELFNTQPNVLNLSALGGADFELAGSASTQDTDTVSVFGQVTWQLTDSSRLSVGGRFNDERKTLSRSRYCDTVDGSGSVLVPGVAPAHCPTTGAFSGSRSSSNFMPELVFMSDLADDVLLYGKISTSAKSGGFVFSSRAPSIDELEYDDETALSFEAGIKSRFAGGRGAVSVTAFHTTFEDLQLAAFQSNGQGGFVSVISNAGKSESVGLETELRFRATDYLTLSMNAAYLDASFTRFELAPCFTGEPDPEGDGICDRSGDALPFAPELTATVAADLAGVLGNGLSWFARASLSHSDDYLTDGTLDPAARQGAYRRLDANFGIGAADGSWEVSLIGRNLTDEYVLNVSQSGAFGGYLGYPGRPRTLSLAGRVRFGGPL